MRTLPWLLLSLLLVTGCPRSPKPSVFVNGASTTPPAAASPTPAPPRRVHLKLAPGELQAKPFTVAGATHELSATLIRLELLDGVADLEDEGLHPQNLADLKAKGDGSYLICEIEVKVDGKPLSDASVKGTFTSAGLAFSYGERTFHSGYHYVGPAPGRPGVDLHLKALEAVRGDGDWRVKQVLYLADQTTVWVEFSGSVKLPDAG